MRGRMLAPLALLAAMLAAMLTLAACGPSSACQPLTPAGPATLGGDGVAIATDHTTYGAGGQPAQVTITNHLSQPIAVLRPLAGCDALVALSRRWNDGWRPIICGGGAARGASSTPQTITVAAGASLTTTASSRQLAGSYHVVVIYDVNGTTTGPHVTVHGDTIAIKSCPR